MFRPIKNLITYIQKNTSGSSIFGPASGGGGGGSSNDIAPASANKSETTVQNPPSKLNECLDEATTTSSPRANMENAKAGGLYRRLPLGAVTTTTTNTTTATTPTPLTVNGNGQLYADEPDPDDIELQIKSSILVKSPRPSITIVPTTSASCSNGSARPDHNQNVAKRVGVHKTEIAVVDEELLTFSDSHRVVVVEGPLSGREFYTFVAAQGASRVASVAELSTFEERADDSAQYLKFGDVAVATEEEEDIATSSTSNLNVSLSSEDPLAIDDTEFAASAAATGVHLLSDDEVVVELVNEPNVVEEDVISLDSSSSQHAMLWLSEASASKNETATTTTSQTTTNSKSNPPASVKLHATAKSRTTDANVGKSNTCEEESPSDGSDSGLGSETSTLQNTTLTDTSMADSPHVQSQSEVPPKVKPLRSNLKRRLDVDDDALAAVAANATSTSIAGGTTSCLQQHQKKPKRSINFEGVQVFYFQRQQGFGCVPSAGGCTLGMGATHTAMRTMTLAEHAAELRRAHRLQLQQQQEAKRHRGGGGGGTGTTATTATTTASSSDDSEESEEDYLSEGSGSDLDGETNGFLQPVSPKQRRIILKAAGVRKIDASEKIDCRDIRNSREVCGCTCRDFCDPDTCACSQAGIKCQVDRAMFPCGCSRDACGNTVGRVEFNPARVRTHFIHTIMRLEMENRQQQNPPPPFDGSTLAVSGVAARVNSAGQSLVDGANVSGGGSGGGYYGLQSQSAYSSGYASPAYSGDLPNYYQPQIGPGGQQQPQHFASGDGVATSEHSSAANGYQMDSLDSAGLFGASSANATPSYGELMPSYATTASYAHAMGYDYPSSQVSSYGAYHHLHQHHLPTHSHHHQHQATPSTIPSSAYLPHASSCTNGVEVNGVANASTYNSCAVPSIPPYGSATTTTGSTTITTPPPAAAAATTTPQYPPTTSTTVSMETNGGSSFINLSCPIASSTRLSQINDLLQHNRHTTAALVAVSTGAAVACGNNERLPNGGSAHALQHQMSSINTPPIEDAQKSCMNFEALPSPLHPTPIVAVLSDSVCANDVQPPEQQQTRSDESPPKPTKPPPPTPLAVTTAQTQADVAAAKAKDVTNTNSNGDEFASTLGTN